MPLDVRKPEFFGHSPSLGEPHGLVSKQFLTLDTQAYLNHIENPLTGSAFVQFTQEAQRFDLRYEVHFDEQYDYTAHPNATGTVVLPNGSRPEDFKVDVYSFTDQPYLQETVPVSNDGTWGPTLAPLSGGNKICRLVAIDADRSADNLDVNGNPIIEGVVLAEDYVWDNPTSGVRLPRSYNVDPNHSAFPNLRYRAFTYDVSVFICALIADGHEDEAANYITALLKTQQRNQQDDDGNAENQTNTDRIPFSVFLHNPQFLIDAYHRTGAEMWNVYCILYFISKFPLNSNVANFKTRLFDHWIALYNQEYVVSPGLQNGLYRGGKGSYTLDLDEENNQLVYLGFTPGTSIPWCANEHNVDAYFVHDLIASQLSASERLVNALVRDSSAAAWRNASESVGSASQDTTIECVIGQTNKDCYIALSTAAGGTTHDPAAASTGGVAVVFDNAGNIDIWENGALAHGNFDTYAKGDLISIERAAAGGFIIYKNETSIDTPTYTDTGAMVGHWGIEDADGEIHKITSFNNVMTNKVYDRTHPIRSFTNIHSALSQDITPICKTNLEAGLVSTSVFYENTEKRGRRGVSDDSTLDECHALDNMTWYGIMRRDKDGNTIEATNNLDYVTEGADGTYAVFDKFYSAQSFKPYVPNNGCYTTPFSTASTWTEGAAGYIMLQAQIAKDDSDTDLRNTAIENMKEIAKVIRIDGIPYVTQPDNIYELQDWGCIVSASWSRLAMDPQNFWKCDYTVLIT